MTLIKLHLTVSKATRFSVLQQFTVKTSEHISVCTVRVLERHTVRKLYRSAKTCKRANKAIMNWYNNNKCKNHNTTSVTTHKSIIKPLRTITTANMTRLLQNICILNCIQTTYRTITIPPATITNHKWDLFATMHTFCYNTLDYYNI